MLPWSYDEDIKKNSLIYFIFHNIKCHQISALTIIFWGNFAGMALKLEKVGSFFFFKFQSCPSLPSIVTDGMKQFQSLNVAWTILEFS